MDGVNAKSFAVTTTGDDGVVLKAVEGVVVSLSPQPTSTNDINIVATTLVIVFRFTRKP